MHHQNDPWDCHQPFGNWANASSRFWLYMIPTCHDICIPVASQFERAICVREKKKKLKLYILINQNIFKKILLHGETAKNWHYSCIKNANDFVRHLYLSCRVHKINTYIIFNSTKRLHFVGITLFPCSQQKYEREREKKEATTTKTERWWVHYKRLLAHCILGARQRHAHA